MEVLEGHILTHGPKVREFEEAFCEYLGGGTCLAIASCTAGLHLYYFSLGIGPGDEVIVPAQTHTATAHAVEFCGAGSAHYAGSDYDCIIFGGHSIPQQNSSPRSKNKLAREITWALARM